MSDANKRDLLFLAGVIVIVAGVWVSFGLGLALIAAGLFGVAVAVAWARVTSA